MTAPEFSKVIKAQYELVTQLEACLKQYDMDVRVRAQYAYDGISRKSVVKDIETARNKLVELKKMKNKGGDLY